TQCLYHPATVLHHPTLDHVWYLAVSSSLPNFCCFRLTYSRCSPATYHYSVGSDWGNCTLPHGASCGEGTQNATLSCLDEHNNPVLLSYCDGPPPSNTRTCSVPCGNCCCCCVATSFVPSTNHHV